MYSIPTRTIAIRVGRIITAHREAGDQQSHAQSEQDIQNTHHEGVLSVVLGLGIILVAFGI